MNVVLLRQTNFLTMDKCIFKIGGSRQSLSDPSSYETILRAIHEWGADKMIIVVSAIGKTTNDLEELYRLRIEGKEQEAKKLWSKILRAHIKLVNALLKSKAQQIVVPTLRTIAEKVWGDPPLYGTIMSVGEKFATEILRAYLEKNNIMVEVKNAERLIKAHGTEKTSKPDLDVSVPQIVKEFSEKMDGQESFVAMTQGFIAWSSFGHIITLGREGSDISALLFAIALKVPVILMKDRPFMSSDPNLVTKETPKEKLPYFIEYTTYRRAHEIVDCAEQKVIHPKAIELAMAHNVDLQLLAEEPDGTYRKTFIRNG